MIDFLFQIHSYLFSGVGMCACIYCICLDIDNIFKVIVLRLYIMYVLDKKEQPLLLGFVNKNVYHFIGEYYLVCLLYWTIELKQSLNIFSITFYSLIGILLFPLKIVVLMFYKK